MVNIYFASYVLGFPFFSSFGCMCIPFAKMEKNFILYVFKLVTYIILHNIIKPIFYFLSSWTCFHFFQMFWNGEFWVLNLFPKLCYLLFVLFINLLTFSSCFIEINFSLTYTKFESIFVCLFSSLPLQNIKISPLPHGMVCSFFSVLPQHVCMNALPFIFILLLLNLGSSVWTFYFLWKWRSQTLFPKTPIILPFKLEVKAQFSSSFCFFVLSFWEEGWRSGLSCFFTFLLQLLVC